MSEATPAIKIVAPRCKRMKILKTCELSSTFEAQLLTLSDAQFSMNSLSSSHLLSLQVLCILARPAKCEEICQVRYFDGDKQILAGLR